VEGTQIYDSVTLAAQKKMEKVRYASFAAAGKVPQR